MPIGGLKEKLLAAHRSGISTVIVPRENRKDLREVPRRVLKATRIVLVEHMDEVLREALCLSDPNQLFGPPRDTMEYRDGELIVGPAGGTPPAGTPPAGSAPEPAPVPANA
jgi:ATP-dependent Lon protease